MLAKGNGKQDGSLIVCPEKEAKQQNIFIPTVNSQRRFF